MLLAFLACEDPARPATEKDAGTPDAPPPAPPQQEGCARQGTLEGADQDPACVLPRASDNVMRDVMRSIAISAEVDPPTVMTGTSAIMRIAITNTAQSETMLVLDAVPRTGAKTDWSRIAGPPEPKVAPPDVPRIFFTMATLDGQGHNVDAIPTIPGGATPVPPAPKLIGIRMRPGGKVTYTAQWWALRIPAPYPPVKDDAGHIYVPKTAPIPLFAGDYTVSIDVPLHGLTPPERVVTTRAHVERANPK
jgi:hypothetical protein